MQESWLPGDRVKPKVGGNVSPGKVLRSPDSPAAKRLGGRVLVKHDDGETRTWHPGHLTLHKAARIDASIDPVSLVLQGETISEVVDSMLE